MTVSLTGFFALLGGLLVLAFVSNRLFRYTRIPTVVVLIATGLLLGPVLGWVNAARFEVVTQAFGTLALILILFEGGLELDVRDTVRHFPGGLLLAVLGYGLTLVFLTPVISWSMRVPTRSAVLMAAVVSCTSAAIVLPVLQQMKIRGPVQVTLLIEASLGDVLAVLTVETLLEYYAFGGSGAGEFVRALLSEVTVSILLAIVAGLVWSRLLPMLAEQRFWQVLTFAAVLLVYAGGQALHGSGLIAVLGFGLTLANIPGIDQHLLETTLAVETPVPEHHQQMLTFHSELAFLVRTFFFVLLGVVVKLAGLARHFFTIVAVLGTVLVARYLAVLASRWSFRAVKSKEERELVFWLFPRGLITAVLAFQILEIQGREFASLPLIAFAIILLTNLLVIFGTLRARWLEAAPIPQPAPAESAEGDVAAHQG